MLFKIVYLPTCRVLGLAVLVFLLAEQIGEAVFELTDAGSKAR
jgi:hypothetical protein